MTLSISRRHFLVESLERYLTASLLTVMPWPGAYRAWLSPIWYRNEERLSLLCATPPALKHIVKTLNIGEERRREIDPYWTVPRYLLSEDEIGRAQKLGAKMCKDEAEFEMVLGQLKKEYYS